MTQLGQNCIVCLFRLFYNYLTFSGVDFFNFECTHSTYLPIESRVIFCGRKFFVSVFLYILSFSVFFFNLCYFLYYSEEEKEDYYFVYHYSFAAIFGFLVHIYCLFNHKNQTLLLNANQKLFDGQNIDFKSTHLENYVWYFIIEVWTFSVVTALVSIKYLFSNLLLKFSAALSIFLIVTNIYGIIFLKFFQVILLRVYLKHGFVQLKCCLNSVLYRKKLKYVQFEAYVCDKNYKPVVVSTGLYNFFTLYKSTILTLNFLNDFVVTSMGFYHIGLCIFCIFLTTTVSVFDFDTVITMIFRIVVVIVSYGVYLFFCISVESINTLVSFLF